MNSKKKIVKMINDLKEETQKLVFTSKRTLINKQISSKKIQTKDE
jgi:preprotein translocase subunit SecE